VVFRYGFYPPPLKEAREMLKLMNDMQKLKANPINFYSTGSHSNNIIINKVIRNYPSLEHDIKFDKK
jgi:hypothetical protein